MAFPKTTQAQPDGCTLSPDSLIPIPFLWLYSIRHCCDAHDLAYHEGGDEADRLAADLALAACIASTGPRWLRWYARRVAVLYFLAVRAFGGWYFEFKPTEKALYQAWRGPASLGLLELPA